MGKKRAVVISNCQCLPLASALTRYSNGIIFDFWGVHMLAPEKRPSAIADFIEKSRNKYDLILSIPLGLEFDALESSIISRTFDNRVVKISNIFFSGFHPDLTYIGAISQRIAGPLGDYHSKIALFSFLSKMSINRARNLFCHAAFERIDYYNEYERSLLELRRRDEQVDVPVTKTLDFMIRRDLCFLSTNHPTLALFSAYAASIAEYLIFSGHAAPSDVKPNPNILNEGLGQNTIFPIYPEIALKHGLPQFGSYAFKPPGDFINCLDLEEFLEKEYAALSRVDFEELSSSPTAVQVLKSLSPLLDLT